MTEVCAPYHLPICTRADVRDVDVFFLCLHSLRGQGLPSAFKEKEVFLCLILRAVSWARASLCERFPAPLDGEGARLKECKTNLLPSSAQTAKNIRIKRIKKNVLPVPYRRSY